MALEGLQQFSIRPRLGIDMIEMFTLTYVVLVCLVLLECLALQATLRKTVLLKRFVSDAARINKFRGLPKDAPAPHFVAPVLGTDDILTTRNLEGHVTILLFASSGQSSSPFYEQLSFIIHVLWSRVEGHLYLICGGTDSECQRLLSDHKIKHVKTVVDHGMKIARLFLVDPTIPTAVELECDLRVRRYGKPEAAYHRLDDAGDRRLGEPRNEMVWPSTT
jgi:hypothetical protein